MNAKQLAAMQAGRRNAQRGREQEAVNKVRAYIRWLESGSNLRRIPPIPTDAEWSIARHRGVKRHGQPMQ